jgi:hypothetical protein
VTGRLNPNGSGAPTAADACQPSEVMKWGAMRRQKPGVRPIPVLGPDGRGAALAAVGTQGSCEVSEVDQDTSQKGEHMNLLRTLAVIVVVGVFVWTAAPVLAVYGGQKGELHPVIRAAIKDLERAKGSLQKRADNDFGGHRVKAIEAIDEALQQLKLALEFEPKH